MKAILLQNQVQCTNVCKECWKCHIALCSLTFYQLQVTTFRCWMVLQQSFVVFEDFAMARWGLKDYEEDLAHVLDAVYLKNMVQLHWKVQSRQRNVWCISRFYSEWLGNCPKGWHGLKNSDKGTGPTIVFEANRTIICGFGMPLFGHRGSLNDLNTLNLSPASMLAEWLVEGTFVANLKHSALLIPFHVFACGRDQLPFTSR